MTSIKIKNGDVVFTSKRLTLVNSLEQKIQRTKGILQTSLGEIFYNTEIGLNRAEVLSIKEKNISDERKKLAIIQAIQQDVNVEKIEFVSIKFNSKTRKSEINLKIKYKNIDNIVETGGVKIE